MRSATLAALLGQVTAGTPLRRTADRLLGGQLDQLVSDSRRQRMSWQQIADQLRTSTDGVIDVNRETLRKWYSAMGRGDRVDRYK